MIKDLEKVKEIFLTKDMDDEDYQDNLKLIEGWEKDLRENEDFGNWQDSDVTKSLVQKFRESYKDFAVELANNRKLTELERNTLYAKQDACIFMLSLVYKDVKSIMRGIEKEIQQILKVGV